jgi:O-antigen/teichoic acid export membrane protein
MLQPWRSRFFTRVELRTGPGVDTVDPNADAGRPLSAPDPASWAGRLGRKLVIMASGTVMCLALSIAHSIVVARLLGPDQLARYATVIVAATLAGQLSDCGLANAFAFYARQRPAALASLLRLLFVHISVCVLLVAALAIFGRSVSVPGLSDALSQPWFAAVLVAFVCVTTAGTVLPVLILAQGHYRAYVMFVNGTLLLQLIFVLVAFVVTGPAWRALVTGVAAAHGVVVVAQVIYLMRSLPAQGREAISTRTCYRYGLRIKGGEVMKLLSGRADLLVVAAVLRPVDVGVYSIALSLREFGMTPLRTYSGILQNLLVDRRRERLDDRTLVIGSILLQIGVSVGLCVAAALTFPYLLPLLFGDDYATLAGPAVVSICATVFLSVAGLCWTVFNMSDRPALTSVMITISGVIGPVLVFLLARRFGLYGAAAAGVITAAISSGLSLVALVRLRGYTRHDLLAAARRIQMIAGIVRRRMTA